MSLQNKVKVRVHVAFFLTTPMIPYFFINISNNCKRQHIKVVGVEFLIPMRREGQLTEYRGLTVDGYGKRPLPIVIPPKTEWETFVMTKDVMDELGSNDVLVTLADGRRLTSKKRKNVAPSGGVPDGQ